PTEVEVDRSAIEYWSADESAVLLAEVEVDNLSYRWFWSTTDGSSQHWLDGLQSFQPGDERLRKDNLLILDGSSGRERFLKAIDLKAGTERTLIKGYDTDVSVWPSPDGKVLIATPSLSLPTTSQKLRIELVWLDTGLSRSIDVGFH